MKLKGLFIFVPLALLPAQQQPPPPAPAPAPAVSRDDIPAETVVATSAGEKITAGDVRKIMDTLPPQMRPNFERDPKMFVNQWFLLKKLLAQAEAEKLDQQSPFKESLAFARMQLLAQAAIESHKAKIPVTEEDLKKAYEARKANAASASLKIIYIPFTANPTPGDPKQRSEKDALARATEALTKARAGQDFAALVKEYSEDPISKEKGGDFGPVKRGDQLPEPVKQAIFSLKKDEISEPLRQPNGYYLFKMLELKAPGLEEMRDELFTALKNERMQQWMQSNAKSVEIEVAKPEFFQPSMPPQGSPQR